MDLGRSGSGSWFGIQPPRNRPSVFRSWRLLTMFVAGELHGRTRGAWKTQIRIKKWYRWDEKSEECWKKWCSWRRAFTPCYCTLFATDGRAQCTLLCCAVLCCAVLCCAVLCCAVLCCAVPYCAVGKYHGNHAPREENSALPHPIVSSLLLSSRVPSSLIQSISLAAILYQGYDPS